VIFVTVGNADPFDRLLQGIDQWIETYGITEAVFAQIGGGQYQPKMCKFVRYMSPDEYRKSFEESRFVIAHAGMGSIITAIELQKLIVVMPKRASLGEQRNEHQLATVQHFKKYQKIRVAEDENELPIILNEVLTQSFESSMIEKIGIDWTPDESLISFVHEFVTTKRR
jgi:UDP-N-acetylglucosamine transferase subunit ALG13